MIGRTVSTILSSTLILTITLNTQLHSTKASDDITSLFDMPHPPPSHIHTTNHLRSSSSHPHSQQQQQQQTPPHRKNHKPAPMTKDELLQWRIDQSERIRQRKLNARERIAQMNPDMSTLHLLSNNEIKDYLHQAQKVDGDVELMNENHSWLRNLWGGGSSGGSSNGGAYANDGVLLDASQSYDWWAQGYRMLGGFVDCDVKNNGGGGSHDNNKNQNQNQGGNECSRWMMWAAYVNPNYQGGGYEEYFGNNNNNKNQDDVYYGYNQPRSKLDCHDPNSDWLLLGVYRQEFYQFIEQISKHLWAIDSYEYVVALAGLAYMTDENCSKVGSDAYGNYLYAGVMPLQGGSFMMGLYYDENCLYPDTSSGYNADSFSSRASGMDLGDKYSGNIDDDTWNTLYGYWYKAQEYTLTMVNDIYEQYKYCTLCLDYPTYQDGYFIGDSGTDDDDIINQCWKFHSHDSYTCTTDCIALGDAQHSITLIKYGDQYYGDGWSGSSKSSTYSNGGGGSSSSTNKSGYQSGADKVEKLKANAYLTFNGVLFIATFLAFSVARGNSSSSSSKDDKKRGLLGRGSSTKSKDKSKSSSSSSKKRSSSKGSTGTSSSRRRSESVGGDDAISRDRSKSASRNSVASKKLSIDGTRTRSRSRSRAPG